ncbi:hypothetical protein GUF92_00905, partial [Xanthomonas citri pv. citri]|nr:hypothetical protein [Xanthomonas citri pv. citri]MBD4863820.1 hypothetical protein [Xanthomonas citri pv. citri]
GENLFDLLMAQSSQSVEPPQNPGRFKSDIDALCERINVGDLVPAKAVSTLVKAARDTRSLS